MKTFQYFAIVLADFLGDDTAIRLTVHGYMPLSIEYIGQSAQDNRMVALSHTGEQNGDLMRDPEMVFELHTSSAPHVAEPLSFRNDYLGIMQEVYRYDENDRKTHVDARLKQELTSFGLTWFQNLKDQGFLSHTAKRERLS